MESKLDYSNGNLVASSASGNSDAVFHTSKYIRNSRAVGVLWGVFTVCSAVLNAVVFASPHWLGDTAASKGPGHFGLWRFCTVLSASSAAGETSYLGGARGGSVVCIGDLNNFGSILSPAFRASTVFVGLSVIVSVLCVLAFVLFCFMRTGSVFEICGTMQFLAGICLAIGMVAFPLGWDNDHVRSICGHRADDYAMGDCGFRWAFVLAVIALLDCWILGALAFTLAHRVVRPTTVQQESHYMNPASIYKGEINSGFIGDTQSLTGSRKSLSLQPVMMMPGGGGPGSTVMMEDPYAQEFGRPAMVRAANPGSPPPGYARAGPGRHIQNFQL